MACIEKPIRVREKFPRASEQAGLADYRKARQAACRNIPEAAVEASIKRYWLDVAQQCAEPLPKLNVCPLCHDKEPHRQGYLNLSGSEKQLVPHVDCAQLYNVQQRLEGKPLWNWEPDHLP